MRKFKATAAFLLCICICMTINLGAFAATAYEVTTPLETITEATGGNGARHSSDSDWATVTAPAGYYINTNNLISDGSLTINYADKDSRKTKTNGFVTITPLSLNGSENIYYMKASNYVTIIPGVSFPRTVQFKVHARSPKGHWVGRGWTKVTTHIKFSKLP